MPPSHGVGGVHAWMAGKRVVDQDTLVMYTRAIKAAAQQIGLPVIVKTLSDGIAIVLETDEERARHIRLNALTQPPSP
jgi:predicted TIM-barrel enzyme